MNLKYEGIIFDLDGVICFTDWYHYLAWKALADGEGIYFDEEINNSLRGVSRMESLEIILKKSSREYSVKEKEKMAARKNELYKNMLKKMSPKDLPEEVKTTLDRLREKGVKLAIGSSSRNAKLILRQIGLEGYFDAVSDGTNITFSKPDPEVFLKAAQYLGIPPQACLVVEDAQAGIQAAAAGKMDSAALGEAVKCGEAVYCMKSISELLEIV